MKKVFFFLALCSATLFMTSCGDDNDDNNGTTASFLRANVDGSSFDSTPTFFLDSSLGDEILFLTGEDVGFNISLNIPTDTPINTAVVVDENDLGILFSDSNETAFLTIGEMTLTENNTADKIMKGTFSFETKLNSTDTTPTHSITSGEFSIAY